MAQVGRLKHELRYGMRRPSLFWSKKAKNYPDVGEVWSTHRDETLWLILMVGRVGWTSWAFEVMNLETAEVDVIHCGDKFDQRRWQKRS
jgi:hypothetical protein